MRFEVIDYCARVGSDRLLVQGAGGNVSWKSGDTLWVKASGTWLARAAEEDIFLPVDLVHMRSALARGDFSATPEVMGGSTLRPSIETVLHALMPHRVVVHLHPVEVLAHVVCADYEQALDSRLGPDISWCAVAYHKPGPELGKAVMEALHAHPDAQVVFLANHGVVVGGEDVETIDRVLQDLLAKLSQKPTVAPVPFERAEPAPEGFRAAENPVVHSLAACDQLFDRLEAEWALYPDHVVFLGAEPYCIDDLGGPARDSGRADLPDLIFARGRGVFARGRLTAAQEAQLACYFEVLVRIQGGKRPATLSEVQVAELVDWDAEKYRRSMLPGK